MQNNETPVRMNLSADSPSSITASNEKHVDKELYLQIAQLQNELKTSNEAIRQMKVKQRDSEEILTKVNEKQRDSEVIFNQVNQKLRLLLTKNISMTNDEDVIMEVAKIGNSKRNRDAIDHSPTSEMKTPVVSKKQASEAQASPSQNVENRGKTPLSGKKT